MKNTSKEPIQKGDKRRYVREALEELGLSTTFNQAAQWIEEKYGTTIGDPTFYNVRKEMQQEASKGGQPQAQPGPMATAAPSSEDAAAPQAAVTRTPPPERAPAASNEPASATAEASGSTSRQGVAALVARAKDLVEQLGKEEAKRLIDAL